MRSYFVRSILLVGLLAGMAPAQACSKENNIDNSQHVTTINNVTQNVGPEGAHVENPDGAAVDIPPGALNQTVTISIGQAAEGTAPPVPAGLAASSPVFAFEPHGLSFALDVVVTIPHRQGGDGSGVKILRAEQGGTWGEMVVSDKTGTRVQAKTTTFSFFASVEGTGGAAGCSGQVAVEQCNDLDDDCDGKTDEKLDGSPLTRDCSTSCGLGTEVCSGGGWVGCTAPQSVTEICNGLDDDCDGERDNGFECSKGATAECGTDIGTCEFGVKVCGPSCTWGACTGGTPSQTEVCDGVKDEDCDGTVDNGCGCTDGNTQDCCGGTKITCAGSQWPSCPAAPAETCDGVDNDCDTKIDEGLPTNPYLLEEDVSGVDDCDHARAVGILVVEGSTPATQKSYLYKSDLAADKDYFLFATQESSGGMGCITNPEYNECFTLTVNLVSPQGQNYEFCLYDVGISGSGLTCSDPIAKKCSGGAGQIVYNLAGGCATDDGHRYYVEVMAGSGGGNSCQSYQLSLELTGGGPQEAACAF